jgi:hypothetical protein
MGSPLSTPLTHYNRIDNVIQELTKLKYTHKEKSIQTEIDNKKTDRNLEYEKLFAEYSRINSLESKHANNFIKECNEELDICIEKIYSNKHNFRLWNDKYNIAFKKRESVVNAIVYNLLHCQIDSSSSYKITSTAKKIEI